jgi:ferredoxin
MSQRKSRVSRRQFIVVGSAAAAAPLLAEFAAKANAAPSQDNAAAADIAKGTKVYYINDQCIGCQVCRANCPAEAIRFGNCRNEIVQSKCVHCGVCYDACHIGNITETVVA